MTKVKFVRFVLMRYACSQAPRAISEKTFNPEVFSKKRTRAKEQNLGGELNQFLLKFSVKMAMTKSQKLLHTLATTTLRLRRGLSRGDVRASSCLAQCRPLWQSPLAASTSVLAAAAAAMTALVARPDENSLLAAGEVGARPCAAPTATLTTAPTLAA